MTTSISNITGTFGLGNNLVIAGSGFGTKTRSKPLSYCDFQNSSLQPNSAVSNATALTGIQNYLWVNSTQKRWGNGGVCVSNWLRDGTSAGRAATLQAATTWSTTNRKLFIHGWRKWLNPDTSATSSSGNWKIIRIWPDGGQGYPNSYEGNQNILTDPNGSIWYTEPGSGGGTTITGQNRLYIGSITASSTWRSETYFLTKESTLGGTNGAFYAFYNGPAGQVLGNVSTGFQYSYPSNSQSSSLVMWQAVKANEDPNGNMQEYVSDFYVDDSFNQVFMGNAATFAACDHLEAQPYTAWADGSVTVVQRPGTFSTGTGTYLYVTDVNGVANSTGYQLNNLNQNPAPPTLTGVTPATGYAVGGNSFTGTCTGLTASLNGVSIGATACTSVVRVSPTSFTAVSPAKAAGTYSIVVTNSDSTTGTLVNGWTTLAAPTVTSCALQISAYTNTPGESSRIWTAPATMNTTAHFYPTSAGFGPKNVIINGTGFVSTGTTTVAIGGKVANNVRYVSSTQLLADFTTAGLGSGTLNVVVTNPDTQTSGTSGNGKFVTSATAPWIYYVQAALPSTGNVSAVSYLMANLAGPSSNFTLTVGGTAATASIITSVPNYNFQLIVFRAPAKAVGNYDIVLTDTDLSQSTTFTSGAHYANLSGGIF